MDKEQVALYRDDGLCTLRSTVSQPDKTRKQTGRIFDENNPNIDDACISKCVDYLDVTKNLQDGTYRKDNANPKYIHIDSNHPPSIVRQIPYIINKRLSDLSSCEQVFDEAKEHGSRLGLWTTQNGLSPN